MWHKKLTSVQWIIVNNEVAPVPNFKTVDCRQWHNLVDNTGLTLDID